MAAHMTIAMIAFVAISVLFIVGLLVTMHLRHRYQPNLIGALMAARQMVQAGESGSIVAILCDGGERYATTYYDPQWLKAQGYELDELIAAVAASVERGEALPESVLRAGI